ncbi:MAG: hypothetical protein CMJ25_29065 [Phycisphaerae bacterium]|nr:hypothetical protein [Phycisphaerae bacterium]
MGRNLRVVLDDVLGMNRLHTSACMTALLLLSVSIVGCQRNQTVVDSGGLVSGDAEQSVELVSGDSFAWEAVFAELVPEQAEVGVNSLVHGPSLVAGDWLAFQCAIAGGYMGSAYEKGTPAYAEVPESWFRFE